MLMSFEVPVEYFACSSKAFNRGRRPLLPDKLDGFFNIISFAFKAA
jgi:hypothetical protein